MMPIANRPMSHEKKRQERNNQKKSEYAKAKRY
jgi:hypothetical protein